MKDFFLTSHSCPVLTTSSPCQQWGTALWQHKDPNLGEYTKKCKYNCQMTRYAAMIVLKINHKPVWFLEGYHMA